MTNLSLVPIVCGVVYAASKPGGVDFGGLTSLPARTALVSTVAFAFAKVLAKRQMSPKVKKARNLDGANVYGLLTLCSCVCLAVPAFLLEGAAAYDALQSTDSMIVLSLVARSGALYYLSNEFSFRVLGMLDPVSQAVANAAKRVFVLAAAAVFLGEVPTTRKIVGSCVALLGVLGYGLSKRDAAKKNR